MKNGIIIVCAFIFYAATTYLSEIFNFDSSNIVRLTILGAFLISRILAKKIYWVDIVVGIVLVCLLIFIEYLPYELIMVLVILGIIFGIGFLAYSVIKPYK